MPQINLNLNLPEQTLSPTMNQPAVPVLHPIQPFLQSQTIWPQQTYPKPLLPYSPQPNVPISSQEFAPQSQPSFEMLELQQRLIELNLKAVEAEQRAVEAEKRLTEAEQLREAQLAEVLAQLEKMQATSQLENAVGNARNQGEKSQPTSQSPKLQAHEHAEAKPDGQRSAAQPESQPDNAFNEHIPPLPPAPKLANTVTASIILAQSSFAQQRSSASINSWNRTARDRAAPSPSKLMHGEKEPTIQGLTTRVLPSIRAPPRSALFIQRKRAGPAFGDAEVHHGLSSPKISSTQPYVISDRFMKDVSPLFIPEHKLVIDRLWRITKHYWDHTRIFPQQAKLESALKHLNLDLWKAFLKTYAECWSPGLKSLDSNTHQRILIEFRQMRGVDNPRPNALSLIDQIPTPAQQQQSNSCTPNPDDDRLQVDVKVIEAQTWERIFKNAVIKDLLGKDLQFDPMECELSKIWPPAPTTDAEAATQIEHFIESFVKINLSEDTMHTAIQVIEAELDNARMAISNSVAEVEHKSKADKALSSHKDNLKLLFQLHTKDYLKLKQQARNLKMADFIALQKLLNGFWTGYYGWLEEAKRELIKDAAFINCVAHLKEDEANSLWSTLFANIMPCEINKDAPLRLFAWSKTIQAKIQG